MAHGTRSPRRKEMSDLLTRDDTEQAACARDSNGREQI
jgi:hypothetical protein